MKGGEWSDWGSWSPCHDGKKVRKRQCNGGAECPGSSVEEDNCPPGNTMIQLLKEIIDFV